MKNKLATVLFMLSAISCTKKEGSGNKAFSPNGDGINDYWTFTGFDNDADAEISVFSRDGLLVFECTGRDPVWNGKYLGADAPIGLYYYQIKTKARKDLIQGSLMLVR